MEELVRMSMAVCGMRVEGSRLSYGNDGELSFLFFVSRGIREGKVEVESVRMMSQPKVREVSGE
ncbi:hypothetical protein CDL15_Pgr027389 [Punica granatum]|uniref:Uncharacterized protein n=1 Tax=Punica granatum TaxID=22663 RepID=A0A218Y2Y2_PUNGR|nr:hypothetical protein CDL15_Pgr027389 [Punica granatum]